MPEDDNAEVLPESIEYTGMNRYEVLDWVKRTSEHYERDDTISASGLALNRDGSNQFTVNVNGAAMSPKVGDQLSFSDRQRKFYLLRGQENPWPRDHPLTPTENRVLYQMTARNGQLPEGVVPPVQSVDQPSPADHILASQLGRPVAPGASAALTPSQQPLGPVQRAAALAARPQQFGEHVVTDITNRIGRNK